LADVAAALIQLKSKVHEAKGIVDDVQTKLDNLEQKVAHAQHHNIELEEAVKRMSHDFTNARQLVLVLFEELERLVPG
jgi:hypothetical protein